MIINMLGSCLHGYSFMKMQYNRVGGGGGGREDGGNGGGGGGGKEETTTYKSFITGNLKWKYGLKIDCPVAVATYTNMHQPSHTQAWHLLLLLFTHEMRYNMVGGGEEKYTILISKQNEN